MKRNYYGSLCTEMYELLHGEAPREELEFYLSYAKKGMKILEPLCGSGRFLVPFLERGFTVTGIDLSGEMLGKLKEKAPEAKTLQADLTEYVPEEKFDYIFIPASSMSLFTETALCKKILCRIKEWLAPGGIFVFGVETIADRCPEDDDYKLRASARTKKGLKLVLKSKNHYEEQSQTQFSPGIYELYREKELLQKECMDFRIRLYRPGEMEQYLKEAGFTEVKTYTSFAKKNEAEGGLCLFECRTKGPVQMREKTNGKNKSRLE